MNDGSRGQAMARRVALAAQRAGIQPDQREHLHRLLSATLERRQTRMNDEHHPDFLHPGRNALILLEDLGVRDPAVLAAAIAFDSMHPPDSPTAEEVVALDETGGAPLLEELLALPVDRQALVEALVVASDAVRLVALVETLDHARHLHLRDPSLWKRHYDIIDAVYLPLATRSDPTLERRLRTWGRAFAERYLPSATDS